MEVILTWKEFRYLVGETVQNRSPNRFLHNGENYTTLPGFYSRLFHVLNPEDFALVVKHNTASPSLACLSPREVVQGDRIRV